MTKDSSTTKSGRKHVAGLDAVRFLAAAMVMFYHLFFYRSGFMPDAGSHVGALPWYGFVGVPIFFVLSGYVIAFSAENSSPGRFAQSRFLRLAPVIWICAAITLATVAIVLRPSPATLIRQFANTVFLVPGWDYLDTVYWTLPIEVVFYFLIWVLLWARGFSAVVPVMIGVGVASSAYNLTRLLQPAGAANADLGLWASAVATLAQREFLPKMLLLEHGCFFSLGVLVWGLQQNGKRLFYWIVGGIVGSVCFWDVYTSGVQALRNVHLDGGLISAPALVWLAAVVAIVAAVVQSEGASGFSPGFESVLRFLGLLTFPLYLLHNMSGLLLGAFLEHHGVSRVVALGLAMAAIMLMSSMVVLWIEPWVRGVLRRLLLRAGLPG